MNNITLSLVFLGAVSILVILALQLFTLYKVQRIDRNTWDFSRKHFQSLENTFQQLEALQALYLDLQLKHSLSGTRGWAGSPDFLLAVVREVQENHPQTVVECSSGISTVILARSLQLNNKGHVFSLEHDAQFAMQTRMELKRHGLSDWATVIQAPLLPRATALGEMRWYDTRDLPDKAIDMVIIDGPPSETGPLARYPAGPILFPKLASTASVLLDDADRQPEQEAVAHWLNQFTELTCTKMPCEKGLVVLRKA